MPVEQDRPAAARARRGREDGGASGDVLEDPDGEAAGAEPGGGVRGDRGLPRGARDEVGVGGVDADEVRGEPRRGRRRRRPRLRVVSRPWLRRRARRPGSRARRQVVGGQGGRAGVDRVGLVDEAQRALRHHDPAAGDVVRVGAEPPRPRRVRGRSAPD
ncbi:hypothetical protein [Clavibacter tessellarius]|uniref:hypothetical protein n=1 Tax=Clavibacter tessellarius TaxID=31965 RepID=UPI0032514FBD